MALHRQGTVTGQLLLHPLPSTSLPQHSGDCTLQVSDSRSLFNFCITFHEVFLVLLQLFLLSPRLFPRPNYIPSSLSLGLH